MMGNTATNVVAIDQAVFEGMRHRLEGLKGSQDGLLLYNLITRGLKKYIADDGKVAATFIQFLHVLLNNYIKHPDTCSATRFKARLIQQRLSLMHAYEQEQAAELPIKSDIAASAQADRARVVAHAAKNFTELPTPVSFQGAHPSLKAEMEKLMLAGEHSLDASMSVDSLEKIERLERILNNKIVDAASYNKEFDSLLRSNLRTLQEIDPENNLLDVKRALIEDIEQLISEHQKLSENLQHTGNYLRVMKSNRELLHSELGKVRQNSRIDELTSLPNREALTEHLLAEMARAHRYGFPLTLARVDIDNFAALADTYGDDAAAAVLRFYAHEVLSRFRTYDLVTHYNDAEFVVLFPNTQIEGAIAALEKVQKAVPHGSTINYCGDSIIVPSFSSGLTQYVSGDHQNQILARTAEALRQAKHLGKRQQIVLLT